MYDFWYVYIQFGFLASSMNVGDQNYLWDSAAYAFQPKIGINHSKYRLPD